MSTFCNLLNNSFPAPVLDVDASDMNVSDANNYIFDLSQVVADDTFEITEQSVDSISIHVLSKSFNGYNLPITSTYSRLNSDVLFQFTSTGNLPTDPYYCNGYIVDNTGEQIQVFCGTCNVILPSGKMTFKHVYEPSDPAWDPTGSYVYFKQFPICDENSKINLPSNYASFDSPDTRIKPDSGFSVICVFKDINPSDVSTLAPDTDTSQVVTISDDTKIYLPGRLSNGNFFISSFGTNNLIPYSGVLICNSKEWSTISSKGTLSKGSSESENTSVSFNPVDGLNNVSRFILWNRDLPLDYLIDYYNKNVLPNAACYFDVSKDYHGAFNVDSYGFGAWQLCDHSGNGLYAQLKNYNKLNNVTRATNIFSPISSRCEYDTPSAGVYHVTKITPPGSPTNSVYNMILFSCPVSSFRGLGTKISVYISTPSGRTFSTDASFSCYDGNTGKNVDFYYTLSSGMNVIDLTNIHSLTEGNNVYIKIPNSFCDKDAEGNFIATNTDFYIICMPVVDLSTHVGWAWWDPNVGDLTSWYNQTRTPATLINKNKVDITPCTYVWNFQKRITPIFEDDKIVVYPPFRTNFKGDNLYSASVDAHLYTSTDDIIKSHTLFTKNEDTGLVSVDYPGYVLFKGEDYSTSVLALSSNEKTVFEQVPNFYDFFQFKGMDGAPYFNILNKDGSYNRDAWNTIIMEFEAPNTLNNTAEYYCQGNLGNIDINESQQGTELAYYYDVPEGSVCYINGQENTSITAVSLRGKRTTVAIVGDNVTTNSMKYIGCVGTGSANDGSNGSSTFKFYKFLAFKEKLTKEQLKKVYEKYDFYMGN